MLTASTAWADAVTLSVDPDIAEGTAGHYYVHMPTNVTNTLTLDGTVTTFKVYDDGGKSGNYTDDGRGVLVLTAPEGYILQLSGSIATPYPDKFYVYEGTDKTGNTLIDGQYTGSATEFSAISTVYSFGRSMTLWLNTTNESYVGAGLDLTVTLVSTSGQTADGGLYVNMPKTDTKTINIPAGVQSFKVFDDGGQDRQYSANCNGYLVLKAPEGYVLQLSGNIQTDGNWGDWFWAYNGTKTSDPMLLSANKSPDGGTQTTINTVTSTGQSMMLRFESNSGGTAAGLDLTVTVVNANTEHNVTVSNPDTGGTVSSNKAKAKVNDNITLTATPASGYILSDLSVTNADGYAMDVAWDVWSNTATFTMIGSDVTVTPTFTDKLTADDGLSFNMPLNSTKTIGIPASVQSFKVYDDGGKDNPYYSGRNTATLVLTAPEGRVLQLSGSIMTRQYDNLTVYDNNAASGDMLIDNFGSPVYKAYNPIPTVCSTGQSMTIYFYGQNQYSDLDGLDLTVTLVPAAVVSNGGACYIMLGEGVISPGPWHS